MRAKRVTFVERLAMHVHPRNGGKEFCMVEAYMDESGIHDGAHVCVIAGYWGSVKKWGRFEKRWLEILKAADEPTLKEFHSTEFWHKDGSRKGVFAKWTDAKADTFIDDLVSCIVDTKLFPTSCVLVVDEWNKLNKNERQLLTGGRYDLDSKRWTHAGAPNKTYFLPFQFAIVNPAIGCSPGLHVHYVFDLNKQFKNHASDLFGLLKNDPRLQCRHRLGTLAMETGEDAPGLQAADLFAYRTYQWAKARIGSSTPTPLREVPPLLRRLVRNLRGDQDFPFFDSYGLNVALFNLPPEMRTEGFKPVDMNESDPIVSAIMELTSMRK